MSDTIVYKPPDAEDRAWLKGLVARANGGDPAAVAELREFLDANPQIWTKLGDLSGHAESAWVGLVAGKDTLFGESLRREAARLRGELLGGRVSPVERLLVDVVVAAHTELEYYRARAAEAPGVTRGQVAMLQKRRDGAQSRYLEAIKTLELVRKLAVRGDAGSRLKVFKAGAPVDETAGRSLGGGSGRRFVAGIRSGRHCWGVVPGLADGVSV